MIRVQLNAFDRHSSSSHSKIVEVEQPDQLIAEIEQFRHEVPFSKYYQEDAILDCPADLLDEVNEILENN